MRTFGVTLFAAFVMVMVVVAADVTGTWEVDASFDDNSIEGGGFDCVFKQAAERLTGNCSGGTASLTGEVDGKNITWRVSNAGSPPVTTVFTGTLNAAETGIEGRFTSGGKGGRFRASKL